MVSSASSRGVKVARGLSLERRSVILHPFNPAYEELVIKGEELDHLYIAGKVVETKAKW